ncbi:unnamed protein product [Amoebophrya sp. A25]|nr:unnamed protein product [Amoebophrya sp. A25]|eukprot:GSA25T00023028001.1
MTLRKTAPTPVPAPVTSACTRTSAAPAGGVPSTPGVVTGSSSSGTKITTYTADAASRDSSSTSSCATTPAGPSRMTATESVNSCVPCRPPTSTASPTDGLKGLAKNPDDLQTLEQVEKDLIANSTRRQSASCSAASSGVRKQSTSTGGAGNSPPTPTTACFGGTTTTITSNNEQRSLKTEPSKPKPQVAILSLSVKAPSKTASPTQVVDSPMMSVQSPLLAPSNASPKNRKARGSPTAPKNAPSCPPQKSEHMNLMENLLSEMLGETLQQELKDSVNFDRGPRPGSVTATSSATSSSGSQVAGGPQPQSTRQGTEKGWNFKPTDFGYYQDEELAAGGWLSTTSRSGPSSPAPFSSHVGTSEKAFSTPTIYSSADRFQESLDEQARALRCNTVQVMRRERQAVRLSAFDFNMLQIAELHLAKVQQMRAADKVSVSETAAATSTASSRRCLMQRTLNAIDKKTGSVAVVENFFSADVMRLKSQLVLINPETKAAASDFPPLVAGVPFRTRVEQLSSASTFGHAVGDEKVGMNGDDETTSMPSDASRDSSRTESPSTEKNMWSLPASAKLYGPRSIAASFRNPNDVIAAWKRRNEVASKTSFGGQLLQFCAIMESRQHEILRSLTTGEDQQSRTNTGGDQLKYRLPGSSSSGPLSGEGSCSETVSSGPLLPVPLSSRGLNLLESSAPLPLRIRQSVSMSMMILREASAHVARCLARKTTLMLLLDDIGLELHTIIGQLAIQWPQEDDAVQQARDAEDQERENHQGQDDSGDQKPQVETTHRAQEPQVENNKETTTTMSHEPRRDPDPRPLPRYNQHNNLPQLKDPRSLLHDSGSSLASSASSSLLAEQSSFFSVVEPQPSEEESNSNLQRLSSSAIPETESGSSLGETDLLQEPSAKTTRPSQLKKSASTTKLKKSARPLQGMLADLLLLVNRRRTRAKAATRPADTSRTTKKTRIGVEVDGAGLEAAESANVRGGRVQDNFVSPKQQRSGGHHHGTSDKDHQIASDKDHQGTSDKDHQGTSDNSINLPPKPRTEVSAQRVIAYRPSVANLNDLYHFVEKWGSVKVNGAEDEEARMTPEVSQLLRRAHTRFLELFEVENEVTRLTQELDKHLAEEKRQKEHLRITWGNRVAYFQNAFNSASDALDILIALRRRVYQFDSDPKAAAEGILATFLQATKSTVPAPAAHDTPHSHDTTRHSPSPPTTRTIMQPSKTVAVPGHSLADVVFLLFLQYATSGSDMFPTFHLLVRSHMHSLRHELSRTSRIESPSRGQVEDDRSHGHGQRGAVEEKQPVDVLLRSHFLVEQHRDHHVRRDGGKEDALLGEGVDHHSSLGRTSVSSDANAEVAALPAVDSTSPVGSHMSRFILHNFLGSLRFSLPAEQRKLRMHFLNSDSDSESASFVERTVSLVTSERHYTSIGRLGLSSGTASRWRASTTSMEVDEDQNSTTENATTHIDSNATKSVNNNEVRFSSPSTSSPPSSATSNPPDDIFHQENDNDKLFFHNMRQDLISFLSDLSGSTFQKTSVIGLDLTPMLRIGLMWLSSHRLVSTLEAIARAQAGAADEKTLAFQSFSRSHDDRNGGLFQLLFGEQVVATSSATTSTKSTTGASAGGVSTTAATSTKSTTRVSTAAPGAVAPGAVAPGAVAPGAARALRSPPPPPPSAGPSDQVENLRRGAYEGSEHDQVEKEKESLPLKRVVSLEPDVVESSIGRVLETQLAEDVKTLVAISIGTESPELADMVLQDLEVKSIIQVFLRKMREEREEDMLPFLKIVQDNFHKELHRLFPLMAAPEQVVTPERERQGSLYDSGTQIPVALASPSAFALFHWSFRFYVISMRDTLFDGTRETVEDMIDRES